MIWAVCYLFVTVVTSDQDLSAHVWSRAKIEISLETNDNVYMIDETFLT